MARPNGMLTDLALGAAAGIAATWVMHQATTYLYEREHPRARRREERLRNGCAAYEIAAEKAARRLTGRKLTAAQRRKLGTGIHWGLGAAAGATYGVLRTRVPGAAAGQGLVFGTAFFGLVDEAANPLLGLTPPPQEFPWQAHARGLAGHLVYGVVADTLLDAADRVLH